MAMASRDDHLRKHTFHLKPCNCRIEPVRGLEQDVDMPDESLCHHDAVDIGTIAHVQEHVRDASRRGLFKGGEHTPYPVDLLFHLLLCISHQTASCGFVEVLGGPWVFVRGCQADVPELVDHVALGMPVLVLAVPEDLDNLLEDGGLAAIAPLCELGRIVVVAVYLAVMLVIAVLSTEHGVAEGAGEVVDMIFALEGSDVGTSQGATALMAQEA